MIPELLRNKIEKKFGKRIKFQKDCKALSAAIEKQCDEKISFLTIQRALGIIETTSKPCDFTIDLLARYAGIEDWDLFIGKNPSPDSRSSYFENADLILSANLEKGQFVKLTYSPDRELTLMYQDNLLFKVIEVKGGKLNVDDTLHILRFELNHPFICESVTRYGTNCGRFTGGDDGSGIILLSLEPKKL